MSYEAALRLLTTKAFDIWAGSSFTLGVHSRGFQVLIMHSSPERMMRERASIRAHHTAALLKRGGNDARVQTPGGRDRWG
jgi:hypothetical protein